MNEELMKKMVVGLLLSSALAFPVVAEDWPRFRGLQAAGVSGETGLLKTWPEEGPRKLWRRPLGEGFSSIVVVGEQLYTLFADGDTELAAAFRVTDGEELWRYPLGAKYVDQWGNGPRATPAVAGGIVYVLASHGHLAALRTSDGKPVWELKIQERFGPPKRSKFSAMEAEGLGDGPFFGYCGSPLLVDDLLIVYTGAGNGQSLVALDRKTGETVWAALDHAIADSSPIALETHGEPQIVVGAPSELLGLSLNGKVLWRQPWTFTPVALPVFIPPDKLFVSAPNDVGGLLMELHRKENKWEVKELWKAKWMRNTWQSSIAYNNSIIGFDNATLKSLDYEGNLQWAKRGLGKGTLIAADGLLFVLSDRGTLILAEASTQAFHEKGRVQVLGSPSWTSPALAGGKLFLRDHQEIVALDVSQQKAED